MLVKQGNKYYQVKFKHKKIQTGGGVQNYLLTYLALLSANELRKLLKFLSAYSRAPNRQAKIKLLKQYKEVLFSFETLEEPAIALMIPILLKGLSGKKTDDTDSTTVSVSTVTGQIKENIVGLWDRLKQFFGLEPGDKAMILTKSPDVEKYIEEQRQQNIGKGGQVPNEEPENVANLKEVEGVKLSYSKKGNRLGRPSEVQKRIKMENSDIEELQKLQERGRITEKKRQNQNKNKYKRGVKSLGKIIQAVENENRMDIERKLNEYEIDEQMNEEMEEFDNYLNERINLEEKRTEKYLKLVAAKAGKRKKQKK
jgi:hypothetical protein